MNKNILTKMRAGLLAGLALLGAAVQEAKAQFTYGNVVVHRVGDGALTLSSAAAPVFLDEFATGLAGQTMPTFTVALPALSTSANAAARLTESGTASSNAHISLSPNGRYLLVPGYDADSGTASIAGSTVPRVIDTVGYYGTVGRAATAGGVFNSNFRGAATDGSNNYWGSGNATGVYYFGNTTTAAGLVGATSNTRSIKVVNGNLYYSSAASTAGYGIFRVGTGLPTMAGQTTTAVITTGTSTSTTSPYDFAFNPAMTACYIADNRAIASGGGIQKWVYSGSAWTLAYTIGTGTNSTVGALALTADFTGTNPVIYAVTDTTSNNKLVKIIDSSSTLANIPVITLANAGAGKYFRGVAMSPGTCTYPVALPQFTVNSPTICAGSSATLTATGTSGTTYAWSTSATSASINVSPAVSTNYAITGTSPQGCTRTDTARVTVNPLPVLNITATSNAVCAGRSDTLTVTGAPTVSWSPASSLNASNTATVIATPAITTTYTVTGTSAAGCTNTATKTVTVNPLPSAVVTPSGATTFCTGGSVTLCVPVAAGNTYLWYNGTTATANTGSCYTIAASGTYRAVVTSSSGCTATSANTTVTVGAPPSATVTPAGPVTICPGVGVRLATNPGPGLTYRWMFNGAVIPGATDSFYVATAAGSYTDSVIAGPGCASVSGTVAVSVAALPDTAVAASGPLQFCAGDSVTLRVSGGAGNTYTWYNNGTAITGAADSSYVARASGAYYVKIVNGNGCADSSAARTVTANPLPTPVITNTAGVLSTGTYASYQWSKDGQAIPGATAQQFTPTASGTYGVTVTDASGCSGTALLPVAVGIGGVGLPDAIRVFPNPATDVVHIAAPVAVNVVIRDMQGRKVMTAGSAKKISIAPLGAGIYLLELSTTDGLLLRTYRITKAGL